MINEILKALHCDNVPRITEGQGNDITRLGAPAIVGAEAGAQDWEMDALDAERAGRFGVCCIAQCGVLIPLNSAAFPSFNLCDDCRVPF